MPSSGHFAKMCSVEYVPRADTIADIALQDTANGSLRTTTSILLGLLVIMSFILNLLLISTILSSSKLRSVVLYLLFCNLALLNIVDTLAGMFVSLLFVANGSWFFSEAHCRFNAAVQQVNDVFNNSLNCGQYASMQVQFFCRLYSF
uniref:G_PROTEIN_RECEP_F1_2 domain-containing protein n=1 Tax=Ascaris lumbricoides TaxID=6252 RepID=A0A0M3HU79_ASCLU